MLNLGVLRVIWLLVVGGLGFEFCVFVAGWRHALRSEWPFIIIIIKGNLVLRAIGWAKRSIQPRSGSLHLRWLPINMVVTSEWHGQERRA